MAVIDEAELEAKVKATYRHVAEQPHGDYHFEMGRSLAERLGYPTEILDRIPAEAIESFAGVGYFFDLAGLRDGEEVIDLGSGSGMDAFVAADMVGRSGRVVGVDFTAEQLAKARRLAAGLEHVQFHEGRIEKLPFADASFDCVISNGVINLSADKPRVFAEAARVLRPGGRLAIADIVTEQPLTEAIVCNVDLWASCIGGATQEDTYRQAIEAAGMRIDEIRANDYQFLSPSARNASVTYGVTSTSVLAVKPSL
jgi:ubiquinone/menaquinone biosynthesis C-methylase UbiE